MNREPSRFACIKPNAGDSAFYVHLTLNEAKKMLRIYYHSSWWKKEKVDANLFTYWMESFESLAPLLPSTKKKPALTKRMHSVHVQGKCAIHQKILHDVLGFVEKNTEQTLPANIECYVNDENKIIEVTLEIKYAGLGDLPAAMHKLPVFTTNPDFESVRSRLVFFDMNYVVGDKTKKKSPEITFHCGSPADSLVVTPTLAQQKLVLDDELKLDLPFASGSHPYGSKMTK